MRRSQINLAVSPEGVAGKKEAIFAAKCRDRVLRLRGYAEREEDQHPQNLLPLHEASAKMLVPTDFRPEFCLDGRFKNPSERWLDTAVENGRHCTPRCRRNPH